MPVLPAENRAFEVTVPLVVVGAGACGLAAGLAARDVGCEVLVLERDDLPQGSTALSSGLVPACATRQQRDKGVEDSVALMAADIDRKARGEADPALVEALCHGSGPTVEWLIDAHAIELTLVEGFLYPGHSRLRMHGPPSRTGAELIAALTAAAERAGLDLVTGARVTDLYADSVGRVRGLRLERGDGRRETLGCGALVLACNGFGGNRELLRQHIPELADGDYFGHAGNTGDALLWGEALGAATRHLGSYQGHGSVAEPQRVLITWALMMEGGIQVNSQGRRFSNEHLGYSEQARLVQAQPGGIAWNLYDTRLHELGQGFEDYRQAEALGAIRGPLTLADLAKVCGLPADRLASTLAEVAGFAGGRGTDPFGRDFTGKPALVPPYYAVKVKGSLFHTQGGLVVDGEARVRRPDGTALPNLFAGGGAACGVSGPADWGYLSGNGLLSALVLGRLAGQAAARLVAA